MPCPAPSFGIRPACQHRLLAVSEKGPKERMILCIVQGRLTSIGHSNYKAVTVTILWGPCRVISHSETQTNSRRTLLSKSTSRWPHRHNMSTVNAAVAEIAFVTLTSSHRQLSRPKVQITRTRPSGSLVMSLAQFSSDHVSLC